MKRIIVAAALMLFACASYAEGESKFVAGVAAAFSDYKGDASFPVDDSGLGVQIFAQARANSWLALEAGYYNSGNFSRDIDPANNGVIDLSFRGFNVAALGFVPVFPDAEYGIDVFGKLGLFDYDIDITEQVGNSRQPGSLGHETGLFVGAGVVLHITDSIGIRSELNWYDINNADLWSLNMGVQIGF